MGSVLVVKTLPIFSDLADEHSALEGFHNVVLLKVALKEGLVFLDEPVIGQEDHHFAVSVSISFKDVDDLQLHKNSFSCSSRANDDLDEGRNIF